MVIVAVQTGANVYQTSGELVDSPQGGGIEPEVEGVAWAVEPQAAGEPTPTGTALAQLSLGGGATPAMVTVWLQVAVLLQPSVACHVRVITWEQGPAPLVTVLRTMRV